MRILVVEDDHYQLDWITSNLKVAMPEASITTVKTEYDFRSSLDNIIAEPPDVVVMDVMLRWTDPSPNLVEPPDDIKEAGFYRAGLRCAKLLREHVETKHTPVILYTVLERSDVHNNLDDLVHLSKQADIGPLVGEIRRSVATASD